MLSFHSGLRFGMPGFWKKLIVFQYVFIQPGGLSWKPARMLCSRGLGAHNRLHERSCITSEKLLKKGMTPRKFEKRAVFDRISCVLKAVRQKPM